MSGINRMTGPVYHCNRDTISGVLSKNITISSALVRLNSFGSRHHFLNPQLAGFLINQREFSRGLQLIALFLMCLRLILISNSVPLCTISGGRWWNSTGREQGNKYRVHCRLCRKGLKLRRQNLQYGIHVFSQTLDIILESLQINCRGWPSKNP